MVEHYIKVTIANRPYRLKIESEEDEEVIRKSAEHIGKLISEYSSKYHYNDFQDLLAMISLHLANNSLSLQSQIDYRDGKLIGNLREIDEFLNAQEI